MKGRGSGVEGVKAGRPADAGCARHGGLVFRHSFEFFDFSVSGGVRGVGAQRWLYWLY